MENNKTLRKLTKDEIVNSFSHSLTVGDLKKFIEENNIPDNAKVMVQRVHDHYFENNNWGVYLKEGYWYNSAEKTNDNMLEEIERRNNGLEPEYDIEDPKSMMFEMNDDLKEQYYPAWSCVRYGDDQDLLFIDSHY